MPEVRRSGGKLGLIFSQRQRRLERPALKGRDQRRRVHIAGYVVPRGAQCLANGDGAGGRIEAHRIAGAPATRWVIRQHASEALIPRRHAPERRPASCKLSGEVDSIGERTMRDLAEFRAGVARAGRLEGNGAGEDPPIDLRQGDMHREIRGAQPALGGAPDIEAGSSQHHLQHRRIERIKRRSLLRVEARREGGGVEHDIKAPPFEKGA